MISHLALFPADPQPFEEHANALEDVLQSVLLLLVALVVSHRLRVVRPHRGLKGLEDGENFLGPRYNLLNRFLSNPAHCRSVDIRLALRGCWLRCRAGYLQNKSMLHLICYLSTCYAFTWARQNSQSSTTYIYSALVRYQPVVLLEEVQYLHLQRLGQGRGHQHRLAY